HLRANAAALQEHPQQPPRENRPIRIAHADASPPPYLSRRRNRPPRRPRIVTRGPRRSPRRHPHRRGGRHRAPGRRRRAPPQQRNPNPHRAPTHTRTAFHAPLRGRHRCLGQGDAHGRHAAPEQAMSTGAPTLSGNAGSQPFAGLLTMLRFTLRRERIRLPVWILGLTAAIAATAASYPGIYATAEERHGALLTISNPGTTALIGAAYGDGDYTYGIMVGHQLLAMTTVVAALMSIFTVVRHTRAEEESGRAEL